MTRQGDLAQPDVRMFAQLDRIAKQLKALARVQKALHELYTSVLGQDTGLQAVLRQVVVTAMDLANTRYGALAVLSEDGDSLVEFVPVGLTEDEEAAVAGLGSPRGRGLLGHLMTDPRPLRVDSISEHPMAAGLPPGHPPVHTLLGVAIRSRGQTYGNLYLSDRHDGRPFDDHDEGMIVALADAAGLAIDDARLLGQVREAEEFQRLLLPRLPDLRPIEAAALYRPATAPRPIGGDWYDAIRLSDDTCAVAIGDIGGHGLPAAAAMAQTRSMLRALLDRTLQAMADTPITTICLARLRPAGTGWLLHWSTAGHPAPLLLSPGEPARYLDAEPGLPLGVDPGAARLTCSIRSPAAPASSSSPTASSNTTSTPSTSAWPPWPGSPQSTPTNPRNAFAMPSSTTTPATARTTSPFWPCGSRQTTPANGTPLLSIQARWPAARAFRHQGYHVADVANVDDLARWIPAAELAQLERDTLILAG